MTTPNTAVQQAQQNAKQAKKALNANACLISRPTISYPSGKMTVDEVQSSALSNGLTIEGDDLKSALQWFPQTALQPLNTQRKQAYALFDAISVSVGSFSLVPLDKLQDVMAKLEEKRIKYLDTVRSIKANFDYLIQKHCDELIVDKKSKDKIPKSDTLKSLIRKAASLNESEFKAVFGFEVFPAMTIQPVFESDELLMQEKAQASLWQETAKAASEHLKAAFKDGAKPTAKSTNGLARIRDKLVALSFLDDGIDRVIDCCDQVIKAMPSQGTLSDHEILVMTHFLTSISHEDTLRATAKGDEENGVDMTRVFKLLLPEVVDEPEVIETVAAEVNQPELEDFETATFADDDFSQQLPPVESFQSDFNWGSF